MRRSRHPTLPRATLLPRHLLPAGLLLLGMTAALAVEALRPRPGLAVYAILQADQPVQGPDASAQDTPVETSLPADWRIRRVAAA